MSKKAQRIALIVLMIAAEIFTVLNYTNGKTELSMLVFCTGLILFLLFGQVAALIREKDD